MACSTATERSTSSWLSPAAASKPFASSRLDALTSRRAIETCCPAPSCTESPIASLAVRNSPSASKASENIDVAEESGDGVTCRRGEREQEPSIEKPVGPLARGLGGEGAA